jgi:hypothetical protein
MNGPGCRPSRAVLAHGRLRVTDQADLVRFSCKTAPCPISGGTRLRLAAEPARWFAAIAQLVEHVIRNDGVTGSSPVCGTRLLTIPDMFGTYRNAFRRNRETRQAVDMQTVHRARLPVGYSSFSPITYLLNYSAGEKSVGSEVIFLSDALRAPEVRGFSIHHVRRNVPRKTVRKPIVQRVKTKSRERA